MERNNQQPHPLRGPNSREDRELLDAIIPIVKPGDMLIFPPDRRVKIEKVFDGMVWVNENDPIQIDDLVVSDEPDTWVYKGDTQARK